MAQPIEFYTQVDEGPHGSKEREYYKLGNKGGHVDDDIRKVFAKEYGLWKAGPAPVKAKAKSPRKKK